MQLFKDKRILFLDGLDNLYHTGLIKGFEELGAIVTPLIYQDYSDRSKWGKIQKNFFGKKFSLYEDKFLDAIKGDFDVVFVKNPEAVPQSVFITLKKRYPKAPFINYNWNSVNLLDYTPYIHLFDKVYTFDPVDAKKYNLEYYPLFYLPEFERVAIGHKKEYDISFVGSTFTPGRPKFLSIFNQLIKEKNIRAFQHLHAYPNIYYKNRLLYNYNFNKLLTTRFSSHQELLDVCKKSLSFIDHPNITQRGHTIRTFETLAAGLLLVTTNKALVDEPFYDSSRIQIIKEDLSDLDLDMIKNYKPSFPTGFERYRIDKWLEKILIETSWSVPAKPVSI